MKIVLASGNKGKIREIKEAYREYEVIPYTELIPAFEIVEDGRSYQENAIIKAEAIYERLKKRFEDFIVLADIPGIYSARYAGEGASDKENLQKLIGELKKHRLKSAPAYYTAAIAIASKEGIYTVHGWMHGHVIDEARGEKGFGYDPMFIPEGFDKSLGELESDVKRELSHRSKALKLARKLLVQLEDQ
ncbi:MAG: non-canonical purine NTP pyrophosphatase [Campylobacteraceae bacterium 4484_4]|nr:MAG: non-canonical purine NTP pyrophosphatase [Campylobacteraceae bacterium 4484_4]